uniref:T cell receptor alpha variable 17 n=1 Tax=Ursus maritimus TaxID=29073 RepID=A0A452VL37_URSMA
MEKLVEASLLILWLQLARVNSQQEQYYQVLTVQEGENATMNCSYKTSISFLQWYRQDSVRGFVQLILIRSNEREKHKQTSGRIKVSLDTSTRQSVLYIAASQPSDSATYFCAVRHSAQPAPVTNT